MGQYVFNTQSLKTLICLTHCAALTYQMHRTYIIGRYNWSVPKQLSNQHARFGDSYISQLYFGTTLQTFTLISAYIFSYSTFVPW